MKYLSYVSAFFIVLPSLAMMEDEDGDARVKQTPRSAAYQRILETLLFPEIDDFCAFANRDLPTSAPGVTLKITAIYRLDRDPMMKAEAALQQQMTHLFTITKRHFDPRDTFYKASYKADQQAQAWLAIFLNRKHGIGFGKNAADESAFMAKVKKVRDDRGPGGKAHKYGQSDLLDELVVCYKSYEASYECMGKAWDRMHALLNKHTDWSRLFCFFSEVEALAEKNKVLKIWGALCDFIPKDAQCPRNWEILTENGEPENLLALRAIDAAEKWGEALKASAHRWLEAEKWAEAAEWLST